MTTSIIITTLAFLGMVVLVVYQIRQLQKGYVPDETSSYVQLQSVAKTELGRVQEIILAEGHKLALIILRLWIRAHYKVVDGFKHVISKIEHKRLEKQIDTTKEVKE